MPGGPARVVFQKGGGSCLLAGSIQGAGRDWRLVACSRSTSGFRLRSSCYAVVKAMITCGFDDFVACGKCGVITKCVHDEVSCRRRRDMVDTAHDRDEGGAGGTDIELVQWDPDAG